MPVPIRGPAQCPTAAGWGLLWHSAALPGAGHLCAVGPGSWQWKLTPQSVEGNEEASDARGTRRPPSCDLAALALPSEGPSSAQGCPSRVLMPCVCLRPLPGVQAIVGQACLAWAWAAETLSRAALVPSAPHPPGSSVMHRVGVERLMETWAGSSSPGVSVGPEGAAEDRPYRLGCHAP